MFVFLENNCPVVRFHLPSWLLHNCAAHPHFCDADLLRPFSDILPPPSLTLSFYEMSWTSAVLYTPSTMICVHMSPHTLCDPSSSSHPIDRVCIVRYARDASLFESVQGHTYLALTLLLSAVSRVGLSPHATLFGRTCWTSWNTRRRVGLTFTVRWLRYLQSVFWTYTGWLN